MTGNSNSNNTTDEPVTSGKPGAAVPDMFPGDLDDVDVGETVGLIDFEAKYGYGRVAVERTEEGESDILKLQRQDADAETGYVDIEQIASVGQWFAHGCTWQDLELVAEHNSAEA